MTTKTKSTSDLLDELLATANQRAEKRVEAIGAAIEACKTDGRLDRNKFEAALPPMRSAVVKLVAPELGRDGLILPGAASSDLTEIASGLGRVGPTIEKTFRSIGERATVEGATTETRDVVASILGRVTSTQGDVIGKLFAREHNTALINSLKSRIDLTPEAVIALAERRLVQ